MTDFSGETLTSSTRLEWNGEDTVSVNLVNIISGAWAIRMQLNDIAQQEDELETAEAGYVAYYEGDSREQFFTAVRLLKYRHDYMQEALKAMCEELDGNASDNSKINEEAENNAGGGR